MRRTARLIILIASIAAVASLWPETADAQRRHPVRRGSVVFVGGYFYDPFFGPYPWWPRTAYPLPYYPIYDNRAEVRVLVTPEEAAVYVDGFYAGIVDDFDGFLQRLPLPPGGHEIVLYLDGYRTVRQRVYLMPASMFKLRYTMERLPAGETSDPPILALPIPPPPAGSFIPPRTPLRTGPPRAPEASTATARHGTLALHVQPVHAEVSIDGELWASSDAARFVLELPAGLHRVDVAKGGYQRFSTEIQVRDGETIPLNVSLTPERPQ
jgi:PEGA domain-containing protein